MYSQPYQILIRFEVQRHDEVALWKRIGCGNRTRHADTICVDALPNEQCPPQKETQRYKYQYIQSAMN